MFTTTKFSTWDLPAHIQSAIDGLGWEYATEVQRDTVPLARRGRDVIGQARTGSGKTAAFGLPMIERATPGEGLQALVLAPTRELAVQVAEELEALQGETGLRMQTVYGGTDIEKQAKQLDAGVDVIVGTPGRVMDMSERGHIDLTKPTMFILDEADRMLDMGFFPDILWVLERMTAREQTLLFSATFPQEIVNAASEFMRDPEFVQTNEDEIDLPDVRMMLVQVGRSNKLWATARVLSHLEEDGQAIIFANTKRMVDLLVTRLEKAKFDV
ncbi:MAG: DEAD/DEAH box helicase, partial [Candidatus Thermoplasmatota archaeon]|nr:DEAD/DEAH box helicase [Candidatus Thermoplasmatota archaeon]